MLCPLPLHQSVLIVGASGQTGSELIEQFSNHPSEPSYVHAFDIKSSEKQYERLCTSIVEGDARNPNDLEYALDKTRARVVIVCIGNGGDNSRLSSVSDLRSATAAALAVVLQQPDFKHVRVILMSRCAVRRLSFNGFRKSNELEDHVRQEKTFLAPFYDLQSRTMVVRPTFSTDRATLVSWIVAELCDGFEPVGGQIVEFRRSVLYHTGGSSNNDNSFE